MFFFFKYLIYYLIVFRDHQVKPVPHDDHDHSSATDIDVTPLPSDEISVPPGVFPYHSSLPK